MLSFKGIRKVRGVGDVHKIIRKSRAKALRRGEKTGCLDGGTGTFAARFLRCECFFGKFLGNNGIQ